MWGRQARALSVELHSSLRARRSELERLALARIEAIADPAEVEDPAYGQSLQTAVRAAISYGLAALEHGEERPPPIPQALLAQARLAARSGIGLDTVLRRYVAGYTLLVDLVLSDSERPEGLGAAELKRLVGSQAALLDRLLVAVSEEYAKEEHDRTRSSERRRAERVRRLLAGEPLDTAELAYDLDLCHLGALVAGPNARRHLRALAETLGCRLLMVRPDPHTVWAWLGARKPPNAERAIQLASRWPAQIAVAFGEPAAGHAGWRLTHRQALVALPVAQRGAERVVRYGEVTLPAAALQNELLATSLHQLYIAPLQAERDGGRAAFETLRAYFATGRNVSSTAAALGINRRTVRSRLQAVEERLGRDLEAVGAELEVALALTELGTGGVALRPI